MLETLTSYKINESIANAYKRIVVEGYIDDATVKKFGNTEEVKKYVNKFKDTIRFKLHDEKKDINYWLKQGFSAFKKFIDDIEAKEQLPAIIRDKALVKIVDGYEIYRVEDIDTGIYLTRDYKRTTVINWDIFSKNTWDSYMKPGVRFFLLIKQNPSKNDLQYNKIGVLLDKDGNIKFAYGARDKDLTEDCPENIKKLLDVVSRI